MNQGVQEVHAWNNYILGTYSRLFHNVEIRDARHKMDHYLVLGCLCDLPGTTNFLKFFAIVHSAFCDKTLAKECTFHTVVPIPKGKGYYWEIGIFEVASLLNCWITAAILFHDTLHRFWEERGTGTTTLEANIIQNITAMREAVLYKVFMDPRKAYDDLDQKRTLDLLAAYGVGPRKVRLLQT